MKKVIITLCMIVLPVFLQAELILLDKVNCVVCGPERNSPFVDTDFTWKRNLDGQLIDATQLVQRDIMNQQITSEKLPLDLSAADKYVESLKKQNNLTDSDLTDLFSQVGRTYQEGLKLLNGQYMHEMFMHHKFKSQLVVSDEELKLFCEEHPDYELGWFEVQYAIVHFTDDNKEQLKKGFDTLVKNPKSKVQDVSWSEPLRLQKTDVADEKKFVFDMKVGEVHYVEANGTFELYKLVDKADDRLRSNEERRSGVSEYLNRQKLEKMLQKYNTEVRKFVDIINLDEKTVVADK